MSIIFGSYVQSKILTANVYKVVVTDETRKQNLTTQESFKTVSDP